MMSVITFINPSACLCSSPVAAAGGASRRLFSARRYSTPKHLMMPNVDPAAPNVFAAAVGWLNGTVLGTMATVLAAVAVASVGFLLMTGRIDVRRAAQVIVGCFILFGASSISAGVMRALEDDGGTPEPVVTAPPAPVYPATVPKAQPAAVPYDPYAGAALPPR